MKQRVIATERTIPVFEPAYNLFRRKETWDLCCAVPEDCPVPAFLDGATWEYAGTLREDDVPPLGLDRVAAKAGARSNGFYLFQIAGPVADEAPIVVDLPSTAVQGSFCWLRDRIDQHHQGRMAQGNRSHAQG